MSKKSLPILTVLVITALMLAMSFASTPPATVHADDPTDFQVNISISGVVKTISATVIVLDDDTNIQIPAGAALPTGVKVGDSITVVVTVNGDALTLVSLGASTPGAEATDDQGEATDAPEATDTPEATDADMEPSAFPTGSATGSATGVPTPAASLSADCGSSNIQPVAQRLANAFNVPYSEIMGWHCAGYGFGEIAKAYRLAQLTGKTAKDIFALRAAGQGWGNIVKSLKVSPKDLAPGQVLKGDKGNDNGNGKGKGNNGKGKGNGDGKGNDNDNGNGDG